jgi:1-deoxy-D-xylulose-5-phosphate reductoisomerase
MKRIAILGSTGSIGRSTLNVIENNPERFQLWTMAAGSNIEAALKDARRWKPKVLSLASEQDAEKVRKQLKAEGLNEIEVVHGQAGTVRVATHKEVDFVVSAIVGVAGLKATYEAVRAGKEIGLANKECLVAAGELITAEARKQGKPLLPIDSEHNAVHQCMRGGRVTEVERVWLTASGGPFLNKPKAEFESITIDSATLMNKGFEVIEACRLFNMPPAQVKVIVHPQSTIHSLVEFNDGSILAQLSVTDMRLPILYALTYPERISSDLRFNVLDLKRLDFCPPDMDKFPCLRLAYEAAEAGGAKTIALNAADEVAVAAFLKREIGFADISKVVERTIYATKDRHPESIEEVLAIDAEAREQAGRQLPHAITR